MTRTPLALGGHNLAPIDELDPPPTLFGTPTPRIVAWRCQLCPLVIPHDGTPWQPWPHNDCPSAARWQSTPRRQ